MIKFRKTNVLLIYGTMIASVRLCGYEQLKYLSETGRIYFQHSAEARLTADQCRWADVLLFVRTASWLSLKIAEYGRREGKFIIYVLDDDLLNIPKEFASAKYYGQKSIRNRIFWFIKNCDIFASPSGHLIDKYSRLAGRTAQIAEPCMNDKKLFRCRNRRLKMGFAGSSDRASDVQEILNDAIENFCKRHHGEAEIEFMGIRPDFAEKWGIRCYPYEQDYRSYQKKFLELNWDVGLAPMPDTEFHRSKYCNKYIEYAASGCVGIYSDVLPYRQVIRDKENGILCGNTKESWTEAMEWCLYHQELLETLRNAALADTRENYRIEKVSDGFVQKMPEIIYYLAKEKKRKIPLGFYRKAGWIVRGTEFLFRYGAASFRKAYEKVGKQKMESVNSKVKN